MIDTLKSLCALSGVSGDEGEVRDYIIGFVSGHADEVITDVMGNVIVFKKGARTLAKKIVLCAHMDEVGVVITGITDDGFLKFAMAGSVDRRIVIGKTVAIGKQRIFGIIGCKAMHFIRNKEREKVMETGEMYIDIGAKNREDAQKLVSIGDTGAFDNEVREFGDGFIRAKAIDDRVGCTVLAELIKSDLPADCYFAFTAQEEVGMRGAYTAAFRTAPDIALIVEGTTAADYPLVDESKKVCKVGSGVVIPFMDQGTVYDRELYKLLTGVAEKNQISWQTKNVVAGATDAAAFQRSRMGVKSAGIAAPVRNLHSPSCVAKTTDIEAVYHLASAFLGELCDQTVNAWREQDKI